MRQRVAARRIVPLCARWPVSGARAREPRAGLCFVAGPATLRPYGV